MKRIAIVEDEAAIRENYKDVLQQHGYSVQTYADRPSAMLAFNTRLPDLAIIDIGLGNEIDGGFMLCQSLRAMSSTLPIIFLTARDSDFDTVCGLRLGADDYLSKEVSFPHLTARLAALFRRSELAASQTAQENLLERGPLTIDANRMQVYWNQLPIELTVTEFWMVHALAKHPGHVRSRHELMQEAKIFVDDSTITSHVKRIRKKFIVAAPEFDCIDTVYGMGYRWDSLA
ncbi:MAG: proteobacterial dedicated sortase system response regulator [Gammaproteobacteria bacterium]|uniref:proteobacterial dedicated sortase system response regulator n=1 Tax=Shewanella TaxID=22 RepID=UPI000CA27575|nr:MULTISPECIES: proteobacterial dedicated sortase system response regulator [Shewanella]EGT3627038.1 proteobacterial dedicated sortase system response regulator [Morganella morganii]MBU1390870.1 proteobacterial dedicated sortase system response regulator [Gammaproteobacteria bacterium]QYX66519.1 proteobacterial dedicated sortase system response regulator [Shewanella putrefaciens]AUD60141.1 DNA-binding response regulator [Shewanella sp. Pdp11]MBU1476093.1 proteobacterial dedicated sortase syst